MEPMAEPEAGPEAGPSTKPDTKRKKRTFAEIAWDYVNKENGRFTCNIDPSSHCQLYQNNYEGGNFIRHFRSLHHDAAISCGLITNPENNPKKKSRVVAKRMIAIDSQQFIEACIRFITNHNLPLSCMEWKGLRLLIDPISQALGVNVSRRNIKTHTQTVAKRIILYIKQEMKGRLVSVKIDSAQRHNRHILGVNAQYEVNNVVVTRTLAMIEVMESQTAKHLKTKILEIIYRYDLTIEQIHSITTDNGANMLAAAKKLRELFTEAMLGGAQNECNATDDNDEFPEDLESELSDQFNIVRCAVHTLQLALNDVVRNTDSSIRSITDFCKNLKKIKYKTFMDFHKASYPPLWSPTRWSGKYKMVRSIIKQESFFATICEHFPELILSDEVWSFMREYEAAFRPLHKMTKLLQSQHQAFSEFYMQWVLALKTVRDLKDNRFSKSLTDALNKRLDMLKGTMVFKAALYLDPRFNYLDSNFFSANEKVEVQNYIMSVWRRIQNLNPVKDNKSKGSQDVSAEEKDIMDYLTELYGGKLDSSLDATDTTMDILGQLKLLEVEPRQRHDFDVWNQWVVRKVSHPQLSKVAMVIFATPSSQVSVERAFSALALVLSDHRTTIADDTLEDILILKLNDDIFEKVFPSMYDWKNVK